MLRFSDDMVIMASSEYNHKNGYETTDETNGDDHKMRINSAKIKTLVCARDQNGNMVRLSEIRTSMSINSLT